MPKTAIVLGATGLVGRSVVQLLAEAAHIERVVTITRRPAEPLSAKIINHVVDFTRLDDHASAFAGDFLFSCLGTTRKEAGSIGAERRASSGYFTHPRESVLMHYLAALSLCHRAETLDRPGSARSKALARLRS